MSMVYGETALFLWERKAVNHAKCQTSATGGHPDAFIVEAKQSARKFTTVSEKWSYMFYVFFFAYIRSNLCAFVGYILALAYFVTRRTWRFENVARVHVIPNLAQL